jgi:hypothetical protein
VWGCEKTMKPTSTKIKKSNYNEPNIEVQKQKRKLI